MAIGLVVALPTGAHRQLLVASGAQNYPSLRVLNPNDGVVYAARNRDIPDLNITSWDWKIPSQSYAAIPGPFQTLGLYYLDQSGGGRAGDISVYASMQKLDDPAFVAVGRAVQVVGTALDITEGVAPANPPANTDRLWVDASGALHILNSSGDSDLFITDETALGGALGGFLPNPNLAANSVGAAQIVDGSISASEIGVQQIIQSLLAKPSVGPNELYAGTAALNIGSLTGALTGTLPNTAMISQQANLASDAALTPSTFQNVLNGPVMSPLGSTWFVMWAANMTCPTTAAILAAALFTPGAQVLSSGSGVVHVNYGGAFGTVCVSGCSIFTTGTASDQLTLRCYATHAGSIARTTDGSFGSGSTSYIRMFRLS